MKINDKNNNEVNNIIFRYFGMFFDLEICMNLFLSEIKFLISDLSISGFFFIFDSFNNDFYYKLCE